MVTEIVSAVIDTVTGFLSGIGTGIVGLFETLFLNSEGTLSALATWVLVLLGVSIALGAVAWVSSLIRNRR